MLTLKGPSCWTGQLRKTSEPICTVKLVVILDPGSKKGKTSSSSCFPDSSENGERAKIRHKLG